jgi:hypothetical protein
VPSLHIIRAHNGVEYRFYELTGDLPDALHFRHYESTIKVEKKPEFQIRIKEKVQIKNVSDKNILRLRGGRVRLRD